MGLNSFPPHALMKKAITSRNLLFFPPLPTLPFSAKPFSDKAFQKQSCTFNLCHRYWKYCCHIPPLFRVVAPSVIEWYLLHTLLQLYYTLDYGLISNWSYPFDILIHICWAMASACSLSVWPSTMFLWRANLYHSDNKWFSSPYIISCSQDYSHKMQWLPFTPEFSHNHLKTSVTFEWASTTTRKAVPKKGHTKSIWIYCHDLGGHVHGCSLASGVHVYDLGIAGMF